MRSEGILNTIFNENCLITMSRIESGTVDLILQDPPYGTTDNEWDIIPNFTEMLKNDREKGIKEIIKHSKHMKNIEEQKMISFYYNPVLLVHCTIDEQFKFMKFENEQNYNKYNERHLMSKEDKK